MKFAETRIFKKEKKRGNLFEELPIKILVAEDNLINQKVAIKMLEKLGYTPDLAVNGEEVLAMTGQKEYDLIFMDIQMPVMDGMEATRIIRKESKDSKPVIVAMTANAMDRDKEASMEAGMNDYLVKPVDSAKIEAAIRKWFTANDSKVI